MPDSKKPFEVPPGFRICGGSYPNFDNYCLNEKGNFYVAVRKSLDCHPGRPLEHSVPLGNLVVFDGENKTLSEFLKEIRDGIERLIRPEHREYVGCRDCTGRYWKGKDKPII